MHPMRDLIAQINADNAVPTDDVTSEQTSDETLNQLRSWVADCEFMNYAFDVNLNDRGEYYLQAHYSEPCVEMDIEMMQSTRKWLLSPAMTKSEVVQTVFKCAITSMEHRTREHFKYRERRVFGPHFDVDALHMIADKISRRSS